MREPNKSDLSWREGEREGGREEGRETGEETEGGEQGKKGWKEEGKEHGQRKKHKEGRKESIHVSANKKQLGRVVVLCTQMADYDCSKQEEWACTLTS